MLMGTVQLQLLKKYNNKSAAQRSTYESMTMQQRLSARSNRLHSTHRLMQQPAATV